MTDIYILIVDDKPQNLFALETVLNGVAAKVIKANSGEDALALTLNYDFALAILDVQMPEMDGYELASYLLDDPNTARIPIIFLSAAYSDEQHTFKGYEQGAVDYIVKPFEPAILLRKVNVFLELARYRIQLEQLVYDRTVALQEEERKLRSIIENTPDIILNIDKEGYITFINAPKKYSQVIGFSIYDFIGKSAIDYQKNALNDVFNSMKNIEFESTFLLPWFSAEAPYSHRLSPIIVDQTVVGCLQIARDISATKSAELARAEKLRAEAENKAKSKFLASMSHEIRTPMNAIIGYTQLLKREQNLSDKQYRYLEVIDSSGEHLLALIDSVLDMARIESGRMVLSPSKVNLAKLISEITRMFQLAANEKGIQISFIQSIPNPEWIIADANKIRQVVINLVGNALKFTQHGSIELRTGYCRGFDDNSGLLRLYVEVKDTGCGIEDDKIKTIFEPFVQADAANNQIGVGLGLAVSKEISRLMGGTLTVQSQINQGSIFRFEFTANHTEEPLQEPFHSLTWHVKDESNLHILVVDDDLDNLNMIGSLLKSVNISVSLANSGSEGLRLFEEQRPGLVILDYQMEPITGIDVVEKIREFKEGEEIPVIIITASPFDEYRDHSIKAGANAFLSKPFREQDLFAAIQKLSPVTFESIKSVYSKTNFQKSNGHQGIPDIKSLSNDLINNLNTALRTGYLEDIDQAIDQIIEDNSSVGQTLRTLADNFEYTKILTMLQDKEIAHD